MEKQFAGRLAQGAFLAALGGLVIVSVVQTNHLESLVLASREDVSELSRRVAQLRGALEDGSLQAAGGAVSGTDDPFARYFSAEEYEALQAPGNVLQLPTRTSRVPGTVPGGTLNRAFSADIPSLLPMGINAADVSELYAYVHTGLAGRDRDDPDRWTPGVAHRIEVNEDRTEYHVWLREGVQWHRPAVDYTDDRYDWLDVPHELTADDFVFGYELMQNEDVPVAYLRNYYQNCEGIEVINDHEFIVRWSASEYTSFSATLGLPPLPRWLYGFTEEGQAIPEAEIGRRFMEHWYAQRAIGAGPFRFVSWQPGGVLRLEKNEEYFDEPPALEAIEFRVLADPTARLNNLKSGDLHYSAIEPTQFKTEIQDGGTPEFADGSLHYEEFAGPAYRYLGWNAASPYFEDRRVRLAMTHAFDRELTIERNLNGLGSLTTGPFFQTNPAYDTSIEPWPFDLERAAELLEEAGWRDTDGNGIRDRLVDGELVEFRFGMLTYGHRPEIISSMEIYREHLRGIGVHMTIETVDWSVMIERMMDSDFDAYTGGWASPWDVDLYQVWHSSQADIPRSSNRVSFRNAEADEIIEAARATFDNDERTELFHRFHAIVHEEQPYTFWFQMREVGAWRDGVQNVSFSALRPFDFSAYWFFN